MTQTAKHTPGPWAAIPPGKGDNENDLWEIHDGYGRTATVYGLPDEPEIDANARLIAAAPDLLAALEDSENLLQEILRTIADNDTVDNIGEQSARNGDVIARAKGN